jgi:sugar phosphate isomerase/epimerase
MSFECLESLGEGYQSVLYSAARRAREKGITIPACHLSFYMPDPHNEELMAKYSRELMRGIDAAALMEIPLAVAHPIALYSKESSYGDWVRANLKFLTPIVEYAKGKGVKICIENMPSEKEAPDNHLYGSCALNISKLAEKLGAGICYDVGHANVSGYKISEHLEFLKGRIDILHIHDNMGKGQKDAHMLPFDGTVDWDDVAEGIKKADFGGVLDVEVTAWALPSDRRTRLDFGGKILMRARRIIAAAELID